MSNIIDQDFETDMRLLRQMVSYGYRPSVIFDVGASDASWARQVVSLFPAATFHLFEPLVDRHPVYSERMNAALSAHPNFHLHQIGLGNENASLPMAVFDNPQGSSFVDSDRMKQYEDEFKKMGFLSNIAEFPVRRLDDLVTEGAVSLPNLVKMDTQGYEKVIIDGGRETLSEADILILETWLQREYGEATPLLFELIPVLSDMGFILTDFGDTFWADKHRMTAIDAVFMREGFLDDIATPSKDWKWRIWQ